MSLPLSTGEQIAAFHRDSRVLSRVEWRDDDGRLVARPLAKTLTLARGVASWAVVVTIPAEHADGFLRPERAA